MHAEDPVHLLKLVLAGGAAANRRALLDAHGAPADCRAAGPGAWRAAGLSELQMQRLRRPATDELGRALAWLEHPGHHLLGWNDPDYPPLLRRISSPPFALFVDGDPTLLWHPGVAVVGSRSPTSG
ncbi:MAG: DNA-processing protein DprA, partial [Pseudoxanthomonas sp.]|nr:DNA-processing protein DprA [Pseudoxanthomonas sp.]